MERDEANRRRVFAYLKANEGASRDEIAATLDAEPDNPITELEVNAALRAMVSEGIVFELSTSVIGGDRYAVVE